MDQGTPRESVREFRENAVKSWPFINFNDTWYGKAIFVRFIIEVIINYTFDFLGL